MRIRTLTRCLPCLAVLAFGVPAIAEDLPDKKYTSEFSIERCTFANQDSGSAGNPLFPLVPGSQIVLEEEEEGAVTARIEITTKEEIESITFVSDDGKTIHVDARVVEEREFEDGEIVEISQNWFARCVETGDVFYFGEVVDPPGGDWRAGVDGAQPGIIMPGTFLLGSRYFQEQAPDVAMDRAEHVKMDLEIETGAGDFEDCVAVKETSSLDSGSSSAKKYCPGVGLVFDDGAELTEIHAP